MAREFTEDPNYILRKKKNENFPTGEAEVDDKVLFLPITGENILDLR